MAASHAGAFYCAHSTGEKVSVVLVLGGARSGKSRFAEALAHQPAHYVATAQAFDNEMRERIAAHKVQRGSQWKTHEEPIDLVGVLKRIDVSGNFILVDCLTLWLSNLLLADADCAAEIQKLVTHLQGAISRIVIVSNEVGLGIVPDNKLARRFRDVQGIANQRVAEVALNVVFMAAGLPLILKGPLPTAQL
jgi:adenosylcobinamide kinase / adenosylcobinamide-phosphate guanylyltransferase